MKLLITGDIHGRDDILDKVLKLEINFDYHLNTGDLGIDNKKIESSKMIAVRGNTDYYYDFPYIRILNIDNTKILLTHGHLQDVKYGLEKLIKISKNENVQICIYGHTHESYVKMIDGILYINPGALSGLIKKTYAIIEDGEVIIKNVD